MPDSQALQGVVQPAFSVAASESGNLLEAETHWFALNRLGAPLTTGQESDSIDMVTDIETLCSLHNTLSNHYIRQCIVCSQMLNKSQ